MTPTQTVPMSSEHDSADSGRPHDIYREIHKGTRYAISHTPMQTGTLVAAHAWFILPA